MTPGISVSSGPVEPKPSLLAARTKVPSASWLATCASLSAAPNVAATSSRSAAAGACIPAILNACRTSVPTSSRRRFDSSLIAAPSSVRCAARSSRPRSASSVVTSGWARTSWLITHADLVGLRIPLICLAAAAWPSRRAWAASSPRRTTNRSGSAEYSSAAAVRTRSSLLTRTILPQHPRRLSDQAIRLPT
jgi:hypothetical protein